MKAKKRHGFIDEVVVAGRRVGAGRGFWSALAHDEELFRKTVSFVAKGGSGRVSTNRGRAREIMSKNFFGIEEAIKHFGVNPSKTELAALAEVPWSEAVLEECQKTHVLVAIFPLSILGIWRKHRHLFRHEQGSDDWPQYYNLDAKYRDELFLNYRGKMSWRLILKSIVPGSRCEHWNDQQAFLRGNEYVPTAQAMVYAIIGHYLQTGESPFCYTYANCADIFEKSLSVNGVGEKVPDRVAVGRLYPSYMGLSIRAIGPTVDQYHVLPIGLAAARKPE